MATGPGVTPSRVPAVSPPDAVLTFGLHRGNGLVSRAIQLQTRSAYSHVSIVRGDGVLLEALQGAGVIARRRLTLVQREERVDVVRVLCTATQRFAAMEFARAQLGKGYDYSSVLRFVSRRQASRKAAGVWFCSELAFAAARQAGISLLGATEPWEVSPGLFARSPLLRWASAGSASGAPSSPSPVPALS